MKCPGCGAENESGAQFCVKCARRLDDETGRRVADIRAAALTGQSTGIRWTAIVAATVCVLALALLLTVLVLFVIR